MSTADSWFARTFPVPAPTWVAPAVSLALIVGASGRAQDYLTRSAPLAEEGRGVDVAGFTVWGSLFLALAAAAVAGLAVLWTFHSRWTVLLSHAFGVALHLAYVLALLQGIPGSGRGVGLVLPPLAAGCVHLVCVGLYVGPRPRKVKAPR